MIPGGPVENMRPADKGKHDWTVERGPGGRLKIVCRDCGRFYGYVKTEKERRPNKRERKY